MRQYKLNVNYFNKIDSHEKAYVLGFLYADGSNTSNYDKNRYCITIVLKESDSQILYDIKNEIGYEEMFNRGDDDAGHIRCLCR